MPEGRAVLLAEAVRFELTDPCESLVFKTRAIDHSTTLPEFYLLGQLHLRFNSGRRHLTAHFVDHKIAVLWSTNL